MFLIRILIEDGDPDGITEQKYYQYLKWRLSRKKIEIFWWGLFKTRILATNNLPPLVQEPNETRQTIIGIITKISSFKSFRQLVAKVTDWYWVRSPTACNPNSNYDLTLILKGGRDPCEIPQRQIKLKSVLTKTVVRKIPYSQSSRISNHYKTITVYFNIVSQTIFWVIFSRLVILVVRKSGQHYCTMIQTYNQTYWDQRIFVMSLW